MTSSLNAGPPSSAHSRRSSSGSSAAAPASSIHNSWLAARVPSVRQPPQTAARGARKRHGAWGRVAVRFSRGLAPCLVANPTWQRALADPVPRLRPITRPWAVVSTRRSHSQSDRRGIRVGTGDFSTCGTDRPCHRRTYDARRKRSAKGTPESQRLRSGSGSEHTRLVGECRGLFPIPGHACTRY